MYLSPYVEEPLNSKVIKSFVPELRSRKCFSCLEIPMFYIYIYIYIYEHYECSMYVSHCFIRLVSALRRMQKKIINTKDTTRKIPFYACVKNGRKVVTLKKKTVKSKKFFKVSQSSYSQGVRLTIGVSLSIWTPSHGRAKAGRPARTYIQQLCEDTGCSSEGLPYAMNDRERWQERVNDIRADSRR